MLISYKNMDKTVLKPSGSRKNWKLRWQNSKIIEDSP